MAVILTLTSTMTGGAMTSTTSGIALTDILNDAVIVSVALVASLVVTELMSLCQGWNETTAVTIRGINITLLIVFCVSLAFKVAQLF